MHTVGRTYKFRILNAVIQEERQFFKGLIFVATLNIRVTGMGPDVFVSLTSKGLFSEHFLSNKYLGSFGAGRYAGLGVMRHFLSQFKMTG